MMTLPQGGNYTLVVNQGTEFSESFQLTEEDESILVPLDGYTAVGQVRLRPGVAEKLADFIIDIDYATSTINVKLSHVDTAKFREDCEYDIFLVNADGTPYLFLEGKIKVNKRVTVIES